MPPLCMQMKKHGVGNLKMSRLLLLPCNKSRKFASYSLESHLIQKTLQEVIFKNNIRIYVNE